jgi:hypothetical protein
MKVVLKKRKPAEVMEIVRELRASGAVQGEHFDFKYCPTVMSDNGWEITEPEHTVFTFHGDTKYATFFILKYGTDD